LEEAQAYCALDDIELESRCPILGWYYESCVEREKVIAANNAPHPRHGSLTRREFVSRMRVSVIQ